jgi:predicted anti-sigma-YlaC factor YlaD
MEQHISDRDVKAYLESELEPERLLSVDEHLAICGECRSRAMAHAGLFADTTFRSLLETDPADADHLSYEMLALYVDGAIDDVDREIVDAHTQQCHECSRQIEDLTKLKHQDNAVIPSALPAKATSWWTAVNSLRWIRLAVPALACVLIAVTLWWVWSDRKENRVETVNVPPANVTGPVVATPVLSPDNVELANSGTGTPGSNAEETPTVLALNDGNSRIEMDANGNLKGLEYTQLESSVKAALTTQSINISPVAKQLRPPGQVTMGESSSGIAFALTGPVGKVIETDRPQFRWQPLKDAESYRVVIFDDNFNKVAESPPLRQTAWTPAARLKRGTIYQWHVVAANDGKEIKSPVMPAPEPKFKVLDANAANEIAAAKRSGGSHLVLGILYANAGLLDESEREFQILAKQNPSSSVVKKLLQKVRSAR